MAGSTEPNPGELIVDSATGRLDLDISPDRKRTYSIKLIVTYEGGNEASVLEVGGVTVTVECGPSSTTLTGPSLEILTKGNSEDTVLSTSGSFATENPLCPINSYQLTTGDTLYDFTQNLPASDSFEVALNAATSGEVGEHNYVVTATAEGGSSLSATGSMIVERWCVSVLNEVFGGNK
jgi:hypothetical protein